MVEQPAQEEPLTLTDQARILLKGVLDPIAGFFNRLGIPPNTMTIIGLIGHAIGAVFLAMGEMTWGGLAILALGPVDALDGTMARLRGESSEWGAFVDSVTDRYSEVVAFGGLMFYYLAQRNWLAAGLVYLALSGSILVSYIRARAKSLGFEIKIGVFSRLERYMVLEPALVLNRPLIGLVILAVGAHLTAVQRIYSMRSKARRIL